MTEEIKEYKTAKINDANEKYGEYEINISMDADTSDKLKQPSKKQPAQKNVAKLEVPEVTPKPKNVSVKKTAPQKLPIIEAPKDIPKPKLDNRAKEPQRETKLVQNELVKPKDEEKKPFPIRTKFKPIKKSMRKNPLEVTRDFISIEEKVQQQFNVLSGVAAQLELALKSIKEAEL
jgi:hypothetical protein